MQGTIGHKQQGSGVGRLKIVDKEKLFRNKQCKIDNEIEETNKAEGTYCMKVSEEYRVQMQYKFQVQKGTL